VVCSKKEKLAMKTRCKCLLLVALEKFVYNKDADSTMNMHWKNWINVGYEEDVEHINKSRQGCLWRIALIG